jgi:hypothetical protein
MYKVLLVLVSVGCGAVAPTGDASFDAPVDAGDARWHCWPPCGAVERCITVIGESSIRLLCCGTITPGCRTVSEFPRD